MLSRSVNDGFLSFGQCYTHGRAFEFLLQLTNKLSIKSSRITKEIKDIVENNKKILQEKLRKKMSAIIDQPKPG